MKILKVDRLGLPTACRLIAVSGARLPSVDGLVENEDAVGAAPTGYAPTTSE